MPTLNAETHAAIAEAVTSNLPNTAWSELTNYENGNVYARFYDSSADIYYFHQPGTPEDLDGHTPRMMQSRLSYPINEDRTHHRKWIIKGPDHRNPHESSLDGSTGTQASVIMYETNQSGHITRAKDRFSSNPNRTYRALARLARLAEANLAQ